MKEEDLIRIERGDPQPIGEAVIAITLFLGVMALLGFIVFGVIW